ncbi:MAG: hypothetical protein AAGC46_07525, partial [Solirubrobacteraceae bacterium]|nr:hypothetical protein [Patulibacter sp.]
MLPTFAPARRLALRRAARVAAAVGFALTATAGPAAAAPISLVKAINTTTADASPTGLTALGGKAYFLAQTSGAPSDLLDDLYVSDGSGAGTTRVAALPHPETSAEQPSTLVTAGGRLYFSHVSTASGVAEVWVSDGTAAGTHALTVHPSSGSIAGGARVVAGSGTSVYVIGTDGPASPASSQDLYRLDTSDPTNALTLLAQGGGSTIQT